MKLAATLIFAALASASALAQNVSNPVVTSAKEIFQRQSDWMISAAEEMPADKYGYKPTPGQWTYGKVIAHVVQGNYGVCGMLSGDGPAKAPTVSETMPKDQLIPLFKQSFETCQKALDNLKDADLGGTISYFGGAKKPRARALIELTDDLVDHYSQMASYLRLNDMVPPSAKK